MPGGLSLRVDTKCPVGFSSDIDYAIECGGNLAGRACRGHGTVLVQRLPFSRLADRVRQNFSAVR
jgi:uncharacterized protein (AIM24 family)